MNDSTYPYTLSCGPRLTFRWLENSRIATVNANGQFDDFLVGGGDERGTVEGFLRLVEVASPDQLSNP